MEYSCSVPVLMIFFNRPDTFRQVFEKVRKAKPKTLILAQDGARNEADKDGIAQCRQIAESVDWECEIIRDYSDINLGCGVRPQSAITSALQKYDRVIILEDDCVPADSFFRYCDDLLEYYKDDSRIAYISGLNHFEEWDCGNSDYFFSKAASIGAWATWRRSWCKYYDFYVNGVNDDYIMKLYKQQVSNKHAYQSREKALIKANKSYTNGEKLSYWDTQWGFAEYTQNMLAIVPRLNQICNIGAGALSTHAQGLTNVKYKRYKTMLFMPTYEMEFPLKHPSYCACDIDYHNLVYSSFRRNIFSKIISKLKNLIAK